MKLGLGTAQFGLPYGVANRSGRVAQREVQSILQLARKYQVDTLDTAIAYGDSEKQLGSAGIQGWKVVSKLPPVPMTCLNVEDWVWTNVEASIQRLGVRQLYGLLLHRPGQLIEGLGHDLYRALKLVQRSGMAQKIGISIYDPDELDRIFDEYAIDLVQAPLNVLDRRLIDTGWLIRLHQSGTEIHVRSVFLQGLLLMSEAERPEKFRRWEGVWADWNRWLEINQLTPTQACLRYAMSFPQISKVIVGIDSLEQLLEVIPASVGNVPPIPAFPVSGDSLLLNPASWSGLP